MKVFEKLSNEQLGRFLLDDDRLFELYHDFEDVPESKLNIASLIHQCSDEMLGAKMGLFQPPRREQV